MKENRNKEHQTDKQHTGKEQQNTSGRDQPVQTGGVHRQKDAVNTTEKKPISHRTGDATNFGDRSYEED
jgi:hypothetical protein